MTRKEQIEIANPYRDWDCTPDNCQGCKEDCYHDGFKEGAEWADNNPNWHKTKINENKYDLPDKIGEEYNVILIKNPNKVRYGIFIGDFWIVDSNSYRNSDIMAWIELPKPYSNTHDE